MYWATCTDNNIMYMQISMLVGVIEEEDGRVLNPARSVPMLIN